MGMNRKLWILTLSLQTVDVKELPGFFSRMLSIKEKKKAGSRSVDERLGCIETQPILRSFPPRSVNDADATTRNVA
jgi:hypothetical protein